MPGPKAIFQTVDSDSDQEDSEANNTETGSHDSDTSQNGDDPDLTMTGTGKVTDYQQCHHAHKAHLDGLKTEVTAAMCHMAMLLNEAPAESHKAKSVKGQTPTECLPAAVLTDVDSVRLTC
ncbi:hypothetical protein K439DRAFT_1611955 [Ramaria rubella]|nr:hypothetical protein K439DRAFT_1611955 [Ramaria rubella]